jgi:hypothetical protein
LRDWKLQIYALGMWGEAMKRLLEILRFAGCSSHEALRFANNMIGFRPLRDSHLKQQQVMFLSGLFSAHCDHKLARRTSTQVEFPAARLVFQRPLMRVHERGSYDNSSNRMDLIQNFNLTGMRCISWNAERCPPHSSYRPAIPTDSNHALPYAES